jgi:hypothetical protein
MDETWEDASRIAFLSRPCLKPALVPSSTTPLATPDLPPYLTDNQGRNSNVLHVWTFLHGNPEDSTVIQGWQRLHLLLLPWGVHYFTLFSGRLGLWADSQKNGRGSSPHLCCCHGLCPIFGQGIWMVLQPYKVMSGEVIRSTGKLRYLAEDVLNYIWYILFSNIYLYSLSQAFLPTHLFTSQTAILSFPFLLLKLPLQHTYHVYDLDPCPVPVS